ncbi:MAG: hypothetical protein RM338_19630, partial [Nostoc sp. DedQUE12a]|nr:hypothetical protein [Nostoc sp. DedQUE12a]
RLFRISLTILGNEFIITIKLIYFKPSPKITIFWVIFIGFFLTFNTSARSGITSELISNINQGGNYFLQVTEFSGATNYNVTFDHFTTTFA